MRKIIFLGLLALALVTGGYLIACGSSGTSTNISKLIPEIPVYPNTYIISTTHTVRKSSRFELTSVMSFGTTDPYKKVFEFYKSNLPKQTWTYEAEGAYSSRPCTGPSFGYDGPTYKHSDGTHIWIAKEATNSGVTHIDIFLVDGPIWFFGDCF